VGLLLRYYKSQGHLRSRGSKEPIPAALLLLSFRFQVQRVNFNLHRVKLRQVDQMRQAQRVEHRAQRVEHRAQRVEHRAQRVN
jgi:hypothetical protein